MLIQDFDMIPKTNKYAISKEGKVIQLREKNSLGLDLKGKFLYLDDGADSIEKVYIHTLLSDTYGVATSSQPSEIVEFLEKSKDILPHKTKWRVEGSAVIVTMPVKLPTVEVVVRTLKLYLLEDAKAIFDPEGKYLKTFLSWS